LLRSVAPNKFVNGVNERVEPTVAASLGVAEFLHLPIVILRMVRKGHGHIYQLTDHGGVGLDLAGVDFDHTQHVRLPFFHGLHVNGKLRQVLDDEILPRFNRVRQGVSITRSFLFRLSCLMYDERLFSGKAPGRSRTKGERTWQR